VCRLIDTARSEGASILAGGGAADLPGYFVKPTIIVNAAQHSTIVREKYSARCWWLPFDPDEAIAMANDSRYGLAASCGPTTCPPP
jgi:phenylacetaldehyde dehydrogenase